MARTQTYESFINRTEVSVITLQNSCGVNESFFFVFSPPLLVCVSISLHTTLAMYAYVGSLHATSSLRPSHLCSAYAPITYSRFAADESSRACCVFWYSCSNVAMLRSRFNACGLRSGCSCK